MKRQQRWKKFGKSTFGLPKMKLQDARKWLSWSKRWYRLNKSNTFYLSRIPVTVPFPLFFFLHILRRDKIACKVEKNHKKLLEVFLKPKTQYESQAARFAITPCTTREENINYHAILNIPPITAKSMTDSSQTPSIRP